jgi:hypothetical protein
MVHTKGAERMAINSRSMTTRTADRRRGAEDRVQVLFIAGAGRSGSTLIANTLGQIDGLWSVGELRQIWQRGLIENWRCGCGHAFSECTTWQRIMADAFGHAGIDPRAVVRAERRLTRVRHIPLVLLSRRRSGLIDARLRGYRGHLERLYRSVRSVTGAQVIVDSSKTPTYGYLLGTIPSIDLRVVHLVRDPRATAYAWAKRRSRADAVEGRFMDMFGPAKSSALWNVWNMTAEALFASEPERYLRLRYEDVMRDLRGSLVRALDLVGRGDADLSFLGTHAVSLSPTHSVSGNPVRMRQGEIEVEPDVEWMKRMRPRDRALVSALTRPVVGRYGYAR